MAKGTDIVRRLTTRGTFITLNGRPGMVRRFNRRTNECLVQWNLSDALVGEGGLPDDWQRDKGLATDHHFTTLRLASEGVVAELEGRRPDPRRPAGGDPS